jgi:hypothetical protein
MLCACCFIGRHDLCAREDETSFCECDHEPTARVIHPADIQFTTVDNFGSVIACAPTREQYLASAAATEHIHFVRNQEHTGGGSE